MKIFKIALAALALGLMSFSVIPSATTTIFNSAINSSVSWKNELINVGEIPQGIPKLIEFELINTGTTPVIITSAKSSCGCTVADYHKEPILPGKKAIVMAKYNASASGAFSKSITVTTSVDDSVKVLIFRGIVVSNSKS